jgi:hypothetical protein
LDGIYAILFGLPALAFACVAIALLFAFPAHRFLKITAMVVAIPALLLGVVFISDALSLVQYTKDDTLNWICLVAYLAMLGLIPYLLLLQIKRKPPVQSRKS